MQTLFDDLRLTLRQLRRSPGFVMTAVLTLTLAIAANVVVFGVANGLLFHALPVPQPEQIVQVQNPGFSGISMSYPNYRDVRDRTGQTFTSLALARFTRLAIGVSGTAQPVWSFMVSGNYFSMLGIQPQLGRFIAPTDDVSVNGSSVVVLSDQCWRTRFNADPGIVGKIVPVGKVPFTVIGVAPVGFHGTEQFFRPEVWLPFHDGQEVEGYDEYEIRGSLSSWVFGRLRPGVTRAQADTDLRRVSEQMAKQYPNEDQGTQWHTAMPGLLGETLGGPVRAFLAGVSVMSLLVLLAACANLGVLFSSRTVDRARELGIRLAIGSSRWRILRQLAMESILIALVGGAAASALATGLLHAMSQWRPPSDLPIEVLVDADWRVNAAAVALALGTGLLFGIWPARQIWRTDPNSTMRAAGTTTAADRSWLRSVLLVVQIALCCLLVTGSVVAFRGLQRTFALPLGFDPQGVTLATVDVTLAGYKDAARMAMQQRLLAAVEAIPGVTAAAYANNQPLSMNTNTNDLFAPGTTTFNHAHVTATAADFFVSPGYFVATRTPLIAGRAFTEHDDANAPDVAIVNETLARKLFGTTDALGKRFLNWKGKGIEVVGLAADGKYRDLSEEPSPAYFRPIWQSGDNSAVLIARSSRSSAEMVVAMRKAVASVDSSIPIFSVSSWPDALGIVTFPARAATVALGVMGALAVMLAVTGIFGVASYTVTRRMRELGIRVALGARAGNVLRAALGRTMTLLAVGSVAGLLLGFAATKLLASVVYHASAADPVVLVAVVLTMAGLGAVSAVVPARRAVRVEPAMLLREE